MNKIIKSIKIIIMTCVVTLFATGTAIIGYEASALPDSINVTGARQVSIASRPHINLVAPDEETTNASVTVDSSYTVTAMLHGVLPIKSIEVTRISPEYVELSGQPVGIMLYSDGLVVAGLSPVSTAKGYISPGQQCGLIPGDVIKAINGQRQQSARQMLETIEASCGTPVDLYIQREEGSAIRTLTLTLQPVYSNDENAWRGGIWIKETSSGLGMLSFVTTDTFAFGGLGHAICDADTGALVQIYGGDLMSAELTGVKPGSKGLPGELIGSLGSEKLGAVSVNCESGVYGQYLADTHGMITARVAMKQELREGHAQILTTLPGENTPRFFDAVIEQINYDVSAPTRNIIVRVTDQELLDAAGGIVQGMSGSPILQDGAFVAALTHVFVNDPAMGYGIFAENMLKFADINHNSTEGAA